MIKILHNCMLSGRRFILNETRNRAAFLGRKNGHRTPLNQVQTCPRYSRNDFNGRPKAENSMYIVCAVPVFLAHFRKPEGAEGEATSWLERLIPLRIRLMFQKEDESPEGRLVMTLKLAILSIQEKKPQKAEQLLHLALRMAQQIAHTDGITLCHDIMANLALEEKQYEKANKLFVHVAQRLLQKGLEQNDITVLHISLKLAEIANAQRQVEKAEMGYQWTLGELEKEVKKHSDDAVLYELWGLANDYYGKFLLQQRRYTEAKAKLTTSYSVYTQIHGREDAHIVDLLNNLAVVCTNLEDYGSAEMYMTDAIEMAQKYPEKFQSGVYHANLGVLYLRKGMITEAKSNCLMAKRMAKKSENADGIEQSTYCLDEIKSVMA